MSTSNPNTPSPAQLTAADRAKLPGMLPTETVIFKTWWKDNYQFFKSVDFNVRVGQGEDPGPAVGPDARAAAIVNSKLRIDAVAFQGNQPFIIEVKYRATPGAIGQLYCYRVLWLIQNNRSTMPLLTLLCSSISADTELCALRLGIQVVKVNADFSQMPVPPA